MCCGYFVPCIPRGRRSKKVGTKCKAQVVWSQPCTKDQHPSSKQQIVAELARATSLAHHSQALQPARCQDQFIDTEPCKSEVDISSLITPRNECVGVSGPASATFSTLSTSSAHVIAYGLLFTHRA